MSPGRRMAAGRQRIANAGVIARELEWLDDVIVQRFSEHAAGAAAPGLVAPPPDLAGAAGPYAQLVRDLSLGWAERLVLALALAPHLAPEKLDPFMIQNQSLGRRFTEFGGVQGQVHGGLLPTVQTALFLLAGTGGPRRFLRTGPGFDDHPLILKGILAIEHRHPEEPPQSGVLRATASGLHRLMLGPGHMPKPGPDFPASLVTTPLDWADLILDEATLRQVETVGHWIEHGDTLMRDWGLARRLKPGYRCLFYGPPGTGKTLTASLLGKRHGLPVYRVDLSRLISKWIGETEKNLAALFDQAEDKGWILFFDEGEALFGRRTEAGSANDRAANQQVAYLLQRLEGHPGVAILATNQMAHLDEAFARRFQSAIRFPMPDAEARLRLWRESFQGHGFTLSPEVDFRALADRYELAGGAIINVLRHACLMAVRRHPPVVEAHDILDGIRQELYKSGRSFGG